MKRFSRRELLKALPLGGLALLLDGPDRIRRARQLVATAEPEPALAVADVTPAPEGAVDADVESPYIDTDFTVVGDEIEGILRQAHESSLSIRQDAARRAEEMLADARSSITAEADEAQAKIRAEREAAHTFAETTRV